MSVHCSSQFTLPPPLGNTSSHRQFGCRIKDQIGNIIHPIYNSGWPGASAGMNTFGDELMDSHQKDWQSLVSSLSPLCLLLLDRSASQLLSKLSPDVLLAYSWDCVPSSRCCAESSRYPRPWRSFCSSLKVVKVDEINASTHTINGRALLLLDTGNHDSEPPVPPVPAAPMSPKCMNEHHSGGVFATIPCRLPCHAIGNHAKPCQASLYAYN